LVPMSYKYHILWHLYCTALLLRSHYIPDLLGCDVLSFSSAQQ
jgi:hypothetical protein